MSSGVIDITLQTLAEYLGVAAVGITVVFFGYIIFFGGHSKDEQKKLGVIFWLFILAALFWSGFEQAGSSLNLFAKDLTNRNIGDIGWLDPTMAGIITLLIAIPVLYMVYRIFQREKLWSFAKGVVAVSSVGVLIFLFWLIQRIGIGWETPASTLQLINPFFIVIFAPIFGFMWTWLASRNANPSIPVKFGLGLLGLAAGFFVLSWGAANATEANPVSPAWLIVTYFLHTAGELCLSPVGLSSMTKLAPKSRVSQMMGIWFVAAAVGNLFAGLMAGQLEVLPETSLFWWVAMIVGGGGIVALIASPFVQRLMGDIE
jgi:POT family proton-dependent oligopeptide transporter